ncbi:hypothetical protein OF83DRAFT_837165 [Amylostereum chailletii]|nr:hypothetical protein OF83DRAFT_837165 [Amylostereum chailletii]
MRPARYAPLPNQRSAVEAEREMDDAFEDDNASDHGETTPLTVNISSVSDTARPLATSTPTPGAYDFERDYDYPPPGSPPRPTSTALPNAYGNSNGLLPSSPIVRTTPRPLSLFRRAFGNLLPSHYQRLPLQPEAPGRGGGMQNDGVFANVMAKPSAPRTQLTEDGDVYIVPEEVQAEAPPSYAAASADAAPAYWENTVHAPSTIDFNGDMLIDELPTGPVITFFITTLVSWFFQLPGFILTYLLHGSHAGKYGSQAGLALTLIQFGLGATFSGAEDLPGLGEDGSNGEGAPIHFPGSDGEPALPAPSDSPVSNDSDPMSSRMGSEWISFILMTIGWFLLLTAIIGYVRVKRFEMSIRAAHTQDRAGFSPEDHERDLALRRNLEEVFGITMEEGQPETPAPQSFLPQRPPPRTEEQARLIEEEARLERDLRAAGLL